MAEPKRILYVSKSSPLMGKDTQPWRCFDIQKEPGFKKDVGYIRAS